MNRWWPYVYWAIGCLALIAAFFAPDDHQRFMAVSLGLLALMRGDLLAVREELDTWRRL